MSELSRITSDPAMMGGKPCIRGMRVTVEMIVDLLAVGRTEDEILAAYPYLEPDDIRQAITYSVTQMGRHQAPPKRQPGSAKGKIYMSPDFDDPLEDFAEYM